ncbi:hypothetical protein FQN57_005935 [Myotisia sp. PD_48]|nr:hypothetical protein FQN57_005935 [Myotisia sp. PD_48]
MDKDRITILAIFATLGGFLLCAGSVVIYKYVSESYFPRRATHYYIPPAIFAPFPLIIRPPKEKKVKKSKKRYKGKGRAADYLGEFKIIHDEEEVEASIIVEPQRIRNLPVTEKKPEEQQKPQLTEKVPETHTIIPEPQRAKKAPEVHHVELPKVPKRSQPPTPWYLMAPVKPPLLYSRQIVLPPRPAKGPPGGARPVNSLISLKSFIALFIGTFCIFIAAVFYWKFGAFFRSFTRGRVTGGGKAATVRYAKTWYGWIPLDKYNARQARKKERLNRFRQYLAWRSSHADYSWVWWDPGGAKFQRRTDDFGRLRWIPSRLLKYAINGCNPNPRPPEEKFTPIPYNPTASNTFSQQRSSQPNRRASHTPPTAQTFYLQDPNKYGQHHSLAYSLTRSRSLHDTNDFDRLRLANYIVTRKAASEAQVGATNIPSLPARSSLQARKNRPDSSHSFGEDFLSTPSAEKTLTWKYRAWGARMQRGRFVDTSLGFGGLAGRPGTPHAMGSMISSGSGSDAIYPFPGTLPRHSNRKSRPGVKLTSDFKNSMDGVLLSNLRFSIPLNAHGKQVLSDAPKHESSGECSKPNPKMRGVIERPSLFKYMSSPEVRLVDDLDRRLEWLSSEMDPGRKAFHFLLLHNHWLNSATWVVMDPASRGNQERRRRLGDPRFRYGPSSISGKITKPKQRAKLDPPHLDSWRRAVNGNRIISGTNEIPTVLKRLSSSADEPPDGTIDPAAWILKKPPQGFDTSNKQKNAYFEGCGGWFEKLDYWQQVPRAYRFRRVVFEGKLNRRRINELACSVSRPCRRAMGKAIPGITPRRFNEKSREREERSGRGTYRRSHRQAATYLRSKFTKPEPRNQE